MAVKKNSLIIKIEGDARGYEQTVKELEAITKQAGASISKAYTTTNESVNKLRRTIVLTSDSTKALEKSSAQLSSVLEGSISSVTKKFLTAEELRQQAAKKTASFQKNSQAQISKRAADRVASAKRVNAQVLADLKIRTSLEKALIQNTSNSIVSIKARQAAKERALASKLANDLKRLAETRRDSRTGRFTNVDSRRNSLLKQQEAALRRIAVQTNIQLGTQRAIISAQKANTRATRATAAAQEKVSGAARTSSSIVQNLANSNASLVKQVFRVVLGYRLVNETINRTLQLIKSIPQAGIQQQANIAALTGVFGSEGAREELELINKVAEEFGGNLVALEKGFRKFAPSALLAGASISEVNQIFTDFTAVGTILSKTEDELESVFVAIDQIFSKGVANSEELKRQLGNQLPAAVEIGAKAFGKSPAAFLKAMKANEVIAKDFVPKFAALYREIFEGPNGVVLANLQVALQANYNRILNRFTEITRAIFNRLSTFLNNTAIKIGSALTFVRDNIDGLGLVVNTLVGLLTGRLIVALVSATTQTLRLAAANLFLTKSMAATATSAAVQGGKFVGFSGVIKNLGTSLNNVSKRFLGLPLVVSAAGLAIAATTALTLRASGVTLDYGKFVGISAEKLQRLQEAAVAGHEPSVQLIKDLGEITNKSNQLTVSLEGVEVSVSSLSEVALERIGNNTKSIRDFISEVGSSVVDLLDIFSKALSGFENFSVKLVIRAARTLVELKDSFKGGASGFVEGIQANISGTAGDRDIFSFISSGANRAALDAENATDRILQSVDELLKKRSTESPFSGFLSTLRENLRSTFAEAADTDFGNLRTKSDNLPGIQTDIEPVGGEEGSVQSTANKAKALRDQASAQNKLNSAIESGADILRRATESTVKFADAKNKSIVSSTKLALLEESKRVGELSGANLLEQANAKAASTALEQIKAATEIKQAQADLNLILLDQTKIREEQAFLIRKINVDESSGTISSLEAAFLRDDANKRYIEQLREIVTLSKSAADASGAATQKQTDDIKKAGQELEILGRKSTEVSNTIRSGLESSLGSAFESIISGSKSAQEAFLDFTKSILEQIVKIIAQELALKAVRGLLGGSSTGGALSSVVDGVSTFLAADGAAVTGASGGRGSVLTKPTLFPQAKVVPFAKGGVLGGEAGPEAILPLTRGSDGKLGVKSIDSASSGGIIIQTLNVTVVEDPEKDSETQGALIGQSIKAELATLMKKEIVDSRKPGGLLNPTQLTAAF